jgi:LysM repeat protein
MAIFENGTVKVQKGDTLGAIAAKAKTTVDAIAKANNIANVNLIKPGQVFNIPTKKTGETPAVTPTETPVVAPTETPVGKTVVSTYIDPASGDTYSVYSDGTTNLLAKGTKAADALLEENRLKLQAQRETARIEAENKEKRQSAYDLLNTEFERYGLASLVTPLKDLITSGVSPSEFTLRLRETDAYKNRFAANQARIKNGLRALSEAEYIRTHGLLDEYFLGRRAFTMTGELGTPYQLIDPSNMQTMESIANTYLPKQITAVAALGNPQGFFDDLLENGVAAKYIPLPDHATYTSEFFESIHADCILITEKDAVKCAAIADERIWVVPMNLRISDDLADWLQSILQRPDPNRYTL